MTCITISELKCTHCIGYTSQPIPSPNPTPTLNLTLSRDLTSDGSKTLVHAGIHLRVPGLLQLAALRYGMTDVCSSVYSRCRMRRPG